MATTSSPVQTPSVLRGARLAKGWGLRETARKAEIDPAHLCRIEQGVSTPSLAVLGRLAEVLDLKDLARYLAPFDPGDRHGS